MKTETELKRKEGETKRNGADISSHNETDFVSGSDSSNQLPYSIF